MSTNAINVLVVDTNHINRVSLCSKISNMGFTAESCVNLDESTAGILIKHNFDIVLIGVELAEVGDLTDSMTVKNLEDIRTIRRHPDKKIRNLPIIAQSVNSHIEVVEQVIGAKADCFTQKMKPYRFLRLEILSLVEMVRRFQE